MSVQISVKQCVIAGLPHNQPTRTSNAKRYRVGLNDRGVELLQKSCDVIKKESVSSKEVFYDTKNKELLALNWWLKVVDNSSHAKLKKVVDSDSETIIYQLTDGAVVDIAELKDLKLEPLGAFVVERQVLAFKQNFILRIDQVIYPDGDPHCVCSLERIENIPSDMYAQLVRCCISPVRSKICEYLYRYDTKTYEILEQKNYVEDIYEMSVLDSQWDQLQSHKSLNQIIARVEGRSLTGPDPWEGVDWDAYNSHDE